MRAPRIDFKIVVSVLSIIVIFLALYYFGDEIGMPTDADTDFLMVVPGIFFFVVGAVIIGRLGGMFAFPAFTVMGIGVAMLCEQMYDLGIINDAMISNLAIGEFQLLVIVVTALIGAIVSGLTSRR